MGEQTHTPGPWDVDGRDIFCRLHSGSSIKVVVAKVAGSDDEADANARLIAAAPEMLEALQIAEELHQVGVLNADEELLRRVKESRRAAIAKSGGQ